jgi:hypothetical protein
MNAPAAPPSRTRSRLVLLLVIGAFALPVILAAVLNRAGWMPGHSRNFGEIVHPPLNLRDVVLVHASDARTTLANEDSRWTLLVRVPDPCDAACWQRVALLGNVRTSLGRYAPLLQPVLLDREPPPEVRPALAAFALASPQAPLPGRLSAPLTAGPELWLVNPYGLVELRYAPGYVPPELRKDLGKLVR